jgi:hypothetical protein
MTEHEKELLYIIQNHDDPEVALEIAMQTIIEFLEQLEPSQEPSLVYSPALA